MIFSSRDFTKTFKFRLRPNREKEKLFAQFCRDLTWIYNRALHPRNKIWEEEKHSIFSFRAK
jgi:hypothetical protein